ncbi:DNA polymerase I [Candidatus Termititenax persephonae]|uniref:DNA polymerase I n=1 Tax=Candidatus Termititenax persephonae TaxID=2218525 RepID=A0A388TFR3_9BACT|nr:DNA polymerase I [Candidatus Termititenax persephonae]
MTRPSFYLIDGHALAYRSFFALPDSMMTTGGQATNAIYGFCKTLFALLDERKPDALAVTFDLPQPTFRHVLYREYKAHRPPSPDNFRSQIPWLKNILRQANIPIFAMPGFEADDLLGTVAQLAAAQGYAVRILTGDKDCLQLVNEQVHLLMPQKGVSALKEMDVAAVGERYGGLQPEQIIDLKALMGDPSDNIPGVPGIGEKTAIVLLQEYGSIDNLKKNIENIKQQAVKAKLTANLESLALSYRLATIDTKVQGEFDLARCRMENIVVAQAMPLLKELQLASLVKKYGGETAARTAALQQDRAATPSVQAEQQDLFSEISSPNLDPQKALSARLMKYLLHPERAIAPEDINQNDIDELPEYVRLLKEQGLFKLYAEIELPLAGVLAEMQEIGVRIDTSFLAKMSRELGGSLAGLAEKIFALAGQHFNLNSPKQLGEVFFEKLQLPIIKKTKTGYSTDAAVLEELAYDYDIARLLLEYRQLSKLKSTYVDALPLLIDGKGKLHTSFNQTVTATGRLSSSEPNLQNIPVRSEAGKKIRQAFIPEKTGHVLLSADYSQIELRILAHYADEKNLQDAFRQGLDIHQSTAAKVFGVPLDKVTSEQRSQAKAVNFGIAYGMSARRLARDVGIPQKEAQEFIDNYFAMYPGIKKYIDDTIALARRQGFVTTLLGRRRHFPELQTGNKQVVAMAERAAINMPIQGTSADLIKMAMIRVAAALQEKKYQAKMILQVHDELVFDLPESEVAAVEALVKEIMSTVYPLKVPLQVNTAVGKNWLEAK